MKPFFAFLLNVVFIFISLAIYMFFFFLKFTDLTEFNGIENYFFLSILDIDKYLKP